MNLRFNIHFGTWLMGLLLLVVMVACETEPEEARGKLTQRGKLVYDEWNQFLTTNVMNDWLDMALRFNAYYEADEAHKIAVEDSLLTQYKVRQNGDVWELRINNRAQYRFTIDQALSKNGAHWECVRFKTSVADATANYGFTDRDVHYVIDCVAPNCWRIAQSADTLLPVSVVIEMTKLPRVSNAYPTFPSLRNSPAKVGLIPDVLRLRHLSCNKDLSVTDGDASD